MKLNGCLCGLNFDITLRGLGYGRILTTILAEVKWCGITTFTFAGTRINIQCNAGFRYQVCICTKVEENHANL
jgi:hypothetical protein